MEETKKNEELLQKFYETAAEDIMDKRVRDIPIIDKDADLIDVLSILNVSDHVWVVESKGSKKLVGIITEYDVLHILSPRKRIPSVGAPDKRSLPYSSFEEASHLMSRDPIKCESNEKVENILDEMITRRIRRMPVVENGDIIGEITLHHLIRKLYALIL
ncbi:MAG: CBS domain-containing protein [Methanophagales archaeon]|nr:CBS domain-containing protein [Methanophagales archaeon]